MPKLHPRLLFLFSELAPNWQSLLETILDLNSNILIDVVYWDSSNRWSSFNFKNLDRLRLIPKSIFASKAIELQQSCYSLIYCAGWMDKSYLTFLFNLRTTCNVVLPVDDWFTGSIVQILKHPLRLVAAQVFFTHAWVAGPWQYSYARALGFSKERIIHHLLSADDSCHAEIADDRFKSQLKKYDFIFCGRNSPEKNPQLLIKALHIMRSKGVKTTAIFIGSAISNIDISGLHDITLVDHCDFSQVLRYMRESKFLVCPSSRDYHPLVVHEALLLGLPVICSSNVGAVPSLLVNSINSFIFNNNSCPQLVKALESAISLSEDSYSSFVSNAKLFAMRLSPSFSALSLLSLVSPQPTD